MANQCEGCVYQAIDHIPCCEAFLRSYCAECKPTNKGPSLYQRRKGNTNEPKVEQL